MLTLIFDIHNQGTCTRLVSFMMYCLHKCLFFYEKHFSCFIVKLSLSHKTNIVRSFLIITWEASVFLYKNSHHQSQRVVLIKDQDLVGLRLKDQDSQSNTVWHMQTTETPPISMKDTRSHEHILDTKYDSTLFIAFIAKIKVYIRFCISVPSEIWPVNTSDNNSVIFLP